MDAVVTPTVNYIRNKLGSANTNETTTDVNIIPKCLFEDSGVNKDNIIENTDSLIPEDYLVKCIDTCKLEGKENGLL